MLFIKEKLTESYFTLLYAFFFNYPMSLEHQYLKCRLFQFNATAKLLLN